MILGIKMFGVFKRLCAIVIKGPIFERLAIQAKVF